MPESSFGTLIAMGVIVAFILGFKVYIHIKSKDVATKQKQDTDKTE